MDQLDQYLRQLASTPASELRLVPNTIPYLVSADGNTDLDLGPLQGSQISTMVFPLIPQDVRQELPNQPSVQFVHPCNVGEFDFRVEKTPAGFSVTVKALGSPAPSSAASPAVSSADLPSIDMSAASFPPIDLQPLNEPVAVPTVQSPQSELGSGLPVLESSNGTSFDAFATRSRLENPGPLTAEDIQGAQEYVPPADQIEPLPVEHVLSNPVFDRRASERTGSNSEMQARIESLFRAMADAEASDLHLSAGIAPMIRKDAVMQTLAASGEVLVDEVLRDLLHSIMPERNKQEFSARRETYFVYEVAGFARFRANIFTNRNGLAAAFRMIPIKVPTAEELSLSEPVLDLCRLADGLVLVTGVGGSGRSTTLAAMVDRINQSRGGHIVTIEDPIEFVHENAKCLIHQREVHTHTLSINDALRAALREDADVIVLSQMREVGTISLALEAAYSGRLVLAESDGREPVSVIQSLIDQFPPERAQQAGNMLRRSIRGIVSHSRQPAQGGGNAIVRDLASMPPAVV